MNRHQLQHILTIGDVSSDELSDFIVLALYDAMPECVEGDSMNERLCALFLHYADHYEPYRNNLYRLYHDVSRNPQHWPITHLWHITSQWMRLVGMKGNVWNQGVMSLLCQQVASSWISTPDENAFLQRMDEMITQTTNWML